MTIDRVAANLPPKDAFMRAVERQQPVERDPDTGAAMLTKYGISADMWEMWSAAAGLPGARWDDPAAASRVAGWAAQALYNEFQDWSLVAVGWKYGAGTARKLKSIYGTGLSGSVVEKIMGKAGARFVDETLQRIYNTGDTDQPPPSPGRRSGGGNVQLQMTVEPFPETEQRKPRGANPAHVALQGVLGAMADRVAGGKRLSVQDVKTQEVPTGDSSEGTVSNVTPEDTEHLNG